MTEKDIKSKKDRLAAFVSEGRLIDAFSLVKEMSEQLMTYELTDKIADIEKSYSYMMDYAMRGASDPGRLKMYESIVALLFNIFDRLERHALINDAPQLYYNTIRYYRRAGVTPDISAMLNEYLSLCRRDSSFNNAMFGKNVSDDPALLAKREELEREIFNSIWVSFPLSDPDSQRLSEFIKDESAPEHSKRLIVSALMMAIMEYFDERKFLLICDAYCQEDNRLSTTALVALILSLYVKRNDSCLTRRCLDRLNAIREMDQWRSDLKSVFLELIRTRDTERITRKLREELVPEMMKMAPNLRRDLKNTDLTDLEENPEWQEMLEKSGLADKMKELSEIQEEGGDVFMGTFAHLKSYRFFSEMANWFLPYHTGHSEVRKLGDDNIVGPMIESAVYLCDNDKYSFILSLNNIPESQKQMMLSQLKGQNENMAEIMSASLDLSHMTRRHHINKYVQNLYRFFELFRRKSDFVNPFKDEINLTEIPQIAEDLTGDDTLRLVAEFYFKHHYYKEALKVFGLCENEQKPGAELYQKMGYCCQKLQRVADALSYYEKADMLAPGSLWTRRRIAAANRQLGNFEEAIADYQAVETMARDDFNVAKAIGDCYLQLGKVKEAIKAYYKAFYLKENDTAVRRNLAWSLLLDRQIDKAEELYRQLVENDADGEDFLNLGHIHVLKGDYAGAVSNYIQAVRKGGWTRERFGMQTGMDFEQLRPELLEDKTVALIVDYVYYSLRNS